MNKRDLKKFEKQLIAEGNMLSKRLNGLQADTLYQTGVGNHTADPDDSAEVGTDSNALETAIRLVGNESEMLYEIEDALKRVENGTYGVCEGTGNPIPKARLEAFPAARFTVEHQADLEKQGLA